MEKVRSAIIVSCLVFLLSLSAVGCARQSTDTMSDSSMEKSMDTMDTDKMGESMKKDMPSDMK